MSQKRIFTQEFKEDAVRYRKEHPELSLQKVASNLGVSMSALRRWVILRFPIKIMALLVIVALILVSCNRGNSMKMKISEKEKSIQELLTKIYSEEQLDEISDLQLDMNGLNSEYPIQCLREIANGYRVAYRSIDSVLLVYFDFNNSKLFSQKHVFSKTKADFKNIKIGQSLDEVRAFDELGDYLFLYTGRTDTPRLSSHYTIDGYVFKISYDEDLKVVAIETELV